MGTLLLSALVALVTTACQPAINEPLPKDMGSFQHRRQIDQMISEMENDFSAMGISINLNQFPIIIADDLPLGIAGVCYHDRAIAINVRLIENQRYDNPQTIPDLWVTLAHEIGHCYFNREHDNKIIRSGPNHVFEKMTFWESNGALLCSPNYNQSLTATVMSTERPVTSMPAEMKKFYLKEMAGIIKKPRKKHLRGLRFLKRIPRSQVQSSPGFTPCRFSHN